MLFFHFTGNISQYFADLVFNRKSAKTEQCFAIYNGENNMKTSAGEVVKWA